MVREKSGKSQGILLYSNCGHPVAACRCETYGQNCNSRCGNCKDGHPCNHVTGECLGGCAEGYTGPTCHDGQFYFFVSSRFIEEMLENSFDLNTFYKNNC